MLGAIEQTVRAWQRYGSSRLVLYEMMQANLSHGVSLLKLAMEVTMASYVGN